MKTNEMNTYRVEALSKANVVRELNIEARNISQAVDAVMPMLNDGEDARIYMDDARGDKALAAEIESGGTYTIY